MDRRFRARGLRVIGLHAPEFESEKDADGVRREVKGLGISWPVVLDNELVMWDALDNRYWPTLYLVDRAGVLRGRHVGETHEGSSEALAFERLLAESDYVTIHCPLTDETRHALDAESLGWMRPRAVLITTARGGVGGPAALRAPLPDRPRPVPGLDALEA